MLELIELTQKTFLFTHTVQLSESTKYQKYIRENLSKIS